MRSKRDFERASTIRCRFSRHRLADAPNQAHMANLLHMHRASARARARSCRQSRARLRLSSELAFRRELKTPGPRSTRKPLRRCLHLAVSLSTAGPLPQPHTITYCCRGGVRCCVRGPRWVSGCQQRAKNQQQQHFCPYLTIPKSAATATSCSQIALFVRKLFVLSVCSQSASTECYLLSQLECSQLGGVHNWAAYCIYIYIHIQVYISRIVY